MSVTQLFRPGLMQMVIAICLMGCAERPLDNQHVNRVVPPPAIVPQDTYHTDAATQELGAPPETWSRYSGELGSLERFRHQHSLESTRQIQSLIEVGRKEYAPIPAPTSRLQDEAEALGECPTFTLPPKQ